MNLQPLHDRLIVRPLKPEEVTKSGLFIPDIAKEKPQQGTVIAVGPGSTREDGSIVPTGITAGNTILYGKYSGSEVTIDDEDLIIMRSSDVFAIVLKD